MECREKEALLSGRRGTQQRMPPGGEHQNWSHGRGKGWTYMDIGTEVKRHKRTLTEEAKKR